MGKRYAANPVLTWNSRSDGDKSMGPIELVS